MPIDMSAATSPKAPPRKTTATRATRATPTPTTPEQPPVDVRTVGLMGLGQVAQMVCVGTKQYAQAATFGMHWAPFAREIAVVADSQPMVAAGVDFLIQIGPFGALFAAGMPFVMQTLANYRVVQPTGTVQPPEVLEAQMKANIARMQADAMREQQAAMEEARKAQADYEAYMQSITPEENASDGTAVQK